MMLFKSFPLFFTLLTQTPQILPPVNPPLFYHLDKIIAYIEEKSACRWQRKEDRNPDESFYCSAPIGHVQFRTELYKNTTLSYFVTQKKKSGMALSLFKFEGDKGITARIIYDGGDAAEFDGVPDKMILKQVSLSDVTRMCMEGIPSVDPQFVHPIEEYELALYQAIIGSIAAQQKRIQEQK